MTTLQQDVCPLCDASASTIEKRGSSYVLLRCCECDLVYATSREIPPHLYEEAYTERGHYLKYVTAAARLGHGHLRLPWAMRRFLRVTSSCGRLLDIGCSTGTFLAAARQRGWQVAGVEPSPTAARIAHSVTGAPIHLGTISDLATEATFDAITAWEVLEHVPTPRAFVKAASVRLSRRGILALSVPNWGSPWTKRSTLMEHWPPFHLTFWTRGTLMQLLQATGFSDIQIVPKPFAWGEEVGDSKWVYLPISLLRALLLGQNGMHLFAIARHGS